ncbi:MAG: nucleotide pyrophosphatase/phosphodiesterase family protein [Thermodesulfobacteriota bacterium]
MKKRRVIVLDVVGLSPDHFACADRLPHLAALAARGRLQRMKPVFPAVTLPVQAALTAGVYPEQHGIVANGFYSRQFFNVSFWEQAAGLVQHERIWDYLHRKVPGLTTAVLFMQNSLYADCDCIVTPRPMHTDDGLVPWCYSKPVGFYEELAADIGPFNLMHYWGPMTSIESSRWIAKAAVKTLERLRPDLMFVYLPHLDYCTQKVGPDSPVVLDELMLVDQEVGRIVQGVDDCGLLDETIFVVVSEYAFSKVEADIPLNRILRENGLLSTRSIQGRDYVDFELSPAFAMVDHQIAHIYLKPGHEKAVRRVLEKMDGIDFLLERDGKRRFHVDHANSGEIIAVSARNRWFSYYWWDERKREPDFAGQVDIHRKPGYDPLELFLEPGSRRISQDTSLIRGSHGYPPLSSADDVPLLVSGNLPDKLGILSANELCVTAVPALLAELLSGEI